MSRARGAGVAAAILALTVLYAGLHYGSTVAGGADSYGYVSQAGLWRQGHLSIQQEIIRASPWPWAIETWAPLGYCPAADRTGAVVPLYAPGLPLLMAAAQAVGGFCAAFLIVPLCGALTVWLTYRLGRRVCGDGMTALAAAALVATSPVFLYQVMNPMSDVPVTFAWTAALTLAIGEHPTPAGVAAGLALLIRPNLAPMAIVLIGGTAAGGWRRAAWLVAGLAPAVAAVAATNAVLYGAPWRSGYGDLGDLYSLGNVTTNLRQFGAWMFETETPVVGAAALFLFAPLRAATEPRHAGWYLGGTIAAVLASYLFYQPFDAWWYLRFLLPMWPALMVLTSAEVATMARRFAPRAPRAVFASIVLAVAFYGVRVAGGRAAFDIGLAERRYVAVARFIADHTDPDAVVLSAQHSGSLRLYAGRQTLRFDRLGANWLDEAVRFLQSRGRHPYFVLEGDEVERFKQTFGGRNELGRLDWRPLAILQGPPVLVYDPLNRTTAEPLAIGAVASRRSLWRCDLPAHWPPGLRMK